MQTLSARSLQAIWHPCTQMQRAAQVPPLAMVRGQGPWLWDDHGNRYFDATSSWWVNLFGHSDPGLQSALAAQWQQLQHVMLAGCTHESAVLLAERLSARTGGALGHLFFASDGASAVEIALKQSMHAWRNQGDVQKTEFVCLQGGYHGETLGALAVTDVPVFRSAYAPLLTKAHIAPSPDSRLNNEAQALDALRTLLEQRHEHIAALILEPRVQGASGMVMHSAHYLRQVRQLCTQMNVHLIADEIAVGCGRTGTFFAWESTLKPDSLASAWPDFLLLSKGISAGVLPLSLVLTTDAVYKAFWSNQTARGFLHSHSYSGNALACAAANYVLDRFDQGQLQSNQRQARYLEQAFAPLRQHQRIQHWRQCGTIVAMDVVDAVDEPNQPAGLFAEQFHLKAREQGLLIRPIGHTLYLMPPYVVDEDSAAFLAHAVELTLNQMPHRTTPPQQKVMHVA